MYPSKSFLNRKSQKQRTNDLSAAFRYDTGNCHYVLTDGIKKLPRNDAGEHTNIDKGTLIGYRTRLAPT